MKKLMIAAAIVCAAAMSQAASYEWNAIVSDINALYKADGESLYSGAGYLFVAEAGADNAAIFDALVAGTALDSLATTYGATSLAFSDGQVASTKFYTDTELGDTINVFMVAQDGNNYFIDILETAESTTLPGGKDVYLDGSWTYGGDYVFDVKDGWQDGAWYTQSVPEPTSGLLLLLGVAGLALRRRRA